MALRFIIGTAGTGKTYLCTQEILAQMNQQDKKQILLVPEQFTSQSEQSLVWAAPNHAILSAQVLSFGRLAHQVFSRHGVGKRLPLSDVGKNMILQKILIERQEDISYFKNTINKTGFVDQLGLTITELFQYQITAEQLYQTSQTTVLSEGMKGKLSDLSMIFESYHTFLSQDYLSGDETLGLLPERLKKSYEYQNTEFWLDGFYGFTPQEMSVIGELLLLCKNVTITLPMDKKSFLDDFLPLCAPFYESYYTKNQLLRLAQEIGVSIAPSVFLTENRRAQTSALRNLEQKFFFAYRDKCALNESLSITACPTKREEIDFAARNILRLVREGGLRYRDIAIVTNASQSYEKTMRTVLREYGIPCFIDSRREIAAHPLITLVRSLFQILVYDFKYADMFSYLKTGFTALPQEDIDLLENYVLAYGINGYKWHRDEWLYGRKKESEDMLNHMNHLKSMVMEPLSRLEKLTKQSKLPMIDFIRLIQEHLIMLAVPEQLSCRADESLTRNARAKADEHKQIWDMLMEVFQSAENILGTTMLSPADCVKILDAGIEKCTMGIIPPTTDSLLVGDIERSRLPEIKYLFVLGVNEGVLPAPADASGIFTETERETLIERNITLAKTAKQKLFEEQFLIYRGLTKPSHGIFLTYAMGNAEGKGLFPSSLVGRLSRMDENLKIQMYTDFSLAEATAQSAFHQLGGYMRAHTQEEPMPDLWKDIFSFFDTHPLWKKRTSMLVDGFSKTRNHEQLSPKTTKSLYGKDIFSSVSRLERFASCPFSFFVEYGLKASERALFQLHTPDLGLLFHEVLEIFSNCLETQGIHWNSLTYDDTERLIHDAVEDAAPRLSNEILLETAANRYLIHRLKRISTRAAWTLVQHLQSGDFTLGGYEVGFGHHDKLPPITIRLSDGSHLVLSGKIDRVDFLDTDGERYIKVIDYKSGAKAFSFQDIYYGLQLQLLIYMDAYLKYHKETEKKVKPAGVFYFRINDPTLSVDKKMTAEEIQQSLYEKMQMSGLVLQNDTIIQSLDHVFANATAGNTSAIVPVGFTKKGEPSSSAYLADQNQYEALLSFVVSQASQIGDEMKSGKISAAPYRKGDQTPCTYCKYAAICRHGYDKNPNWRNLEKVDKKTFWEKIPPVKTQ